jgi:hypothetical protein
MKQMIGVLFPIRRPTSTPVWTQNVGGTMLTLMRQTRYVAEAVYALYAIEHGQSRHVRSYHSYPEALAGVQEWVAYLQGGGTVAEYK